jgi:hypothetical protein
MEEAWSILRPLLLEIVLPAVAASAATMLGLWCLVRFLKLSAAFEVWMAPLAIAGGLAAGNYQQQDNVPYWSLEQDYYSLIPATLGMLLLAAIAEWHRVANRPLLALGSHVAGALIVAFWLTPVDAPGSRWLWVGILFIAFRANYFSLAGVWNDAMGRWGMLVLPMLWGSIAGATLLVFVHAMRFFDLVSLLSGAMMGTGLVALFTRANLRGGYAAAAIYFPAAIFFANHSSFSDVPYASFMLLGIAPCVMLLALPELGARMEAWPAKVRVIVAMLLIIVPLAAALAMAAINVQSNVETTAPV